MIVGSSFWVAPYCLVSLGPLSWSLLSRQHYNLVAECHHLCISCVGVIITIGVYGVLFVIYVLIILTVNILEVDHIGTILRHIGLPSWFQQFFALCEVVHLNLPHFLHCGRCNLAELRWIEGYQFVALLALSHIFTIEYRRSSYN